MAQKHRPTTQNSNKAVRPLTEGEVNGNIVKINPNIDKGNSLPPPKPKK